MQCSTCNKPIQGDFQFCPYCGSKTNTACSGCGKAMMAGWVACPYCGFSEKQSVPNYSSPHNHSSEGKHDYSRSSGNHHRKRHGLLGSFFSS